MSPNALQYVLNYSSLHSIANAYIYFNIFIDIWTIYGAILKKIGLFLENRHYHGISYWRKCVRVRATRRFISANIDPIDLKFGEMIL